MNGRSYRVGGSTITIYHGDITHSSAEVLVSSDDYLLTMGGGVSWALRRAAGHGIVSEAKRMVPARAGEVVVTSAGDLSARYILHAITIGPERTPPPCEVIIRQATRRVMELLPLLRCRSVAFPSLGTGVAGMSRTLVASEMASTLVNFLLADPGEYRVELWLMDRPDVPSRESESDFIEAFVRKTLGVVVGIDGGVESIIRPPEVPASGSEAETAEGRRRSEIFSILRYLDEQRRQVEAALLGTLGGGGQAGISLAEARTRLQEVVSLRQIYEHELEELEKRLPVPYVPGSVFLSSTYMDLAEHRKALRVKIEEMGLKFIGMEDFYPNGFAPPKFIQEKVREAQSYLAVLGMRYGSIDPNSGLSMTHLEYNQAAACGKRMLVFVIHDEALVRVAHVERELNGYDRLMQFRSRVLKEKVCGMFRDIPELVISAEKALREAVPTSCR